MKLRKLLVVAVLALSSAMVFAQTPEQNLRIKEEGKIEFKSHWYMQLQGGAAYTLGEAKFGDLISPTAALYAGYQFTPVWGLRFGASGWESRGGWVSPATVYKFNYVQGNVDVTMDLCNFGKFNHRRFFNAYLLLGIGVNGAFNNDEAVALNASGKKLTYIWDDNKIGVAGRAGLGINMRLCDAVALNIEANGNILTDKYNSKKAGNPDWQFNLVAGLTIKFGKGYKKTAPVYYEPEPEPAPVVEEPAPAPEPAPVVEEPAPVVEEPAFEPLTENVYFKINSSIIEASENAKIDALVEFLNENENTKIVICGYADKETGRPAYNQTLSEKRANKVAKVLKDKGIAADRISIDAKGDTVQPFAKPEENRVCICVVDE